MIQLNNLHHQMGQRVKTKKVNKHLRIVVNNLKQFDYLSLESSFQLNKSIKSEFYNKLEHQCEPHKHKL